MIKNGWTRVAFGDVVRQVRDHVEPEESGLERYVAGEHMETDDLRIRRWGLIGDGYLGPAFHMRFKPGQVLYGSRRTYLRKVAVADFEGVTANTTFVLESKDSKVLMPELLPFIMQSESFHDHSVKQSKGSVNPYINFSDLTWYEFFLPPSEEQERIVSMIQASDETIYRCDEAVSALETLISALARDSFATESSERRSELKSLVSKLGSGKTPFGGETVYVKAGILFLRSQNIHPDGLRLDDAAFIPEQIDQQMASTRVQNSDVLLNITGASIGRCAVYTLDRPANVNQHVCILRPIPDLLDPWYLSFFIQSEYGQQLVASFMTNGNRQGLNFQQLGGFKIPHPDLHVQRRIGALARELHETRELLRSRRGTARKTRGVLLATALADQNDL